jgi:hypothetical protein
MASHDLYVHLDRPDVSAEDFADAIEEQIALVREIGVDLGIPMDGVRWVIRELSAGSAAMLAVPQIVNSAIRIDQVEASLQFAGEGLAALEKSATRPTHFTDEALRRARRLSEIANIGNGVGASEFRFGSVLIAPTSHGVANIDELIVGKYKSIGSVEGHLATISDERGLHFSVKDRLRGRAVPCYFDEKLLPRVVEAFRRRVIVRGVVWSRRDGLPQRIDARDFEIVPDDNELPNAGAVRGALRGWQESE